MKTRSPDQNLQGLLETRLAPGTEARKALGYLGILSAPKLRMKLETLLRDHREWSVTMEPTGWMREAVDEFLEVCELVEIGVLAGVFRTPLEGSYVKWLKAALEKKPLHRYYTEFYPTALPSLLLQRLRGLRKHSEQCTQQLAAAYSTMLNIDVELFGNEDIATYFLGVLDGYDWGDGELDAAGFWIEVERRLNDPRQLAKIATSEGDDEEGPMDAACRGFLKFTGLIRPLSDLLISVERWPRVRAAMWLHYAYWFTQMRSDVEFLMERLREVIRHRAKRKAKADSREIEAEMLRRADALHYLCDASSFAFSPWGMMGDGGGMIVPKRKGRGFIAL